MSDLTDQLRNRLNEKKGADIAKTFTSEEDLLQVKSWIPLKEFFKLATGGEGFPCGHITQIVGEPDSGKCHTKGTKVIMFDGSIKKVEDIAVGDKLMGPDSSPRTVLALGRGEDELYEITPNKGGDSFGVNKAHILSLVNSSYNRGGFKPGEVYNISVAEYLMLNDTLKHKLKLYRTEIDFEEQQVEYDPYWVGLWLGDGTKNETAITKDEPDLEAYFEQFSENYGLTYRKRLNPTRCSTYLFTASSGRVNPLLNFVRESLIVDDKKRIPSNYLVNSRVNRLKLLAGLLDSDGHLHVDTGTGFEIVFKTKELSEDVTFLARSLGFQVSSCEKPVKLDTWEEARIYHRLNISGACSQIPTKITRKKAKDSKINRSPLRTRFSIKSLGYGEYYGFTLDGDHLYLLGDTTVTHNTSLLMEGMVECQKAGGVAYLIDSEHKFSLSRFALMGGIAEDIIILPVESLEDAWDRIKIVCEVIGEQRERGKKEPMMICWDSIAASVPNKIIEEEEAGNAHVAVEAKINNKNVRKLRQFIKSSEVACVFINHYYTTMPQPGRPPKDIIKGGEELTFMSTLVVKTKKGAKIERGVKGETQQIGRVTKFQILKGHFHGRTIEKEVYVVDKGFLQSKEELDEYKKSLRGDI